MLDRVVEIFQYEGMIISRFADVIVVCLLAEEKMEGAGTNDFFKRAVLQMVPELTKERAYWKAKAISLAAENERLHAALKSLVLGCKFEDVYEGKFASGLHLDNAEDFASGAHEEEDAAESDEMKADAEGLEEEEEEEDDDDEYEYEEEEEEEEVIELDPEYAAFLQATRLHQKAMAEARDAIELVSEGELDSEEDVPDENKSANVTTNGENVDSLSAVK